MIQLFAPSVKRFFPLLALLALLVAAWAGGLHTRVSLENFHAHKEHILMLAAAHPVATPALFMLVYALAAALSLPIATLLTLLGGFLFGSVFGTLYVVFSASLGAVVVFLVARTALGESLRKHAGKWQRKVAGHMKENAVSYLLFLRLVPLFPFAVVNVLPALFHIPLRTYLWTTFLGIIPGTFVYVNLGRALGNIDSLSGLVSGQTLLALSLLGGFALLPVAVRKFRKHKKGRAQ